MTFLCKNLLILSLVICTSYGKTPPDHKRLIATARYVINNAKWGVIGSVSTIGQISGLPFTNIVSIADGFEGNGTGTPYMFTNVQDQTFKDHLLCPNVSLTVSENMLGYCEQKKWDAEDPRCARLTLVGRMVVVEGNEAIWAKKILFHRHPAMKWWSFAHKFYVSKIEIGFIWLLDYFGKANQIDVKAYYAAKSSKRK